MNSIPRFLIGIVFLLTLCFEDVSLSAQTTQEITFLHDVQEWQEIFTGLGQLSAMEIGIRAVPSYLGTHVYKSRIIVDLPGANAPAIFKWWSGYRAQQLISTGQLADLSDIWDKVEKNYPPGIRDSMTLNGVAYGFPLHASYWIWYYNKPLYQKFGLQLPNTWDEFIKQLDFFKSKGIHGIGNAIGRHPNRQRWMSFILFQEILYRIDAQFYQDLMNGKVHWTDHTVVQTMEIWKSLLDNGYYAPTDITFGEDLPRMFKEGEIVFAPFGDWYGAIMQRQGLEPGKDFDFFIPPAITAKGRDAIVLEVAPLVVAKNAPAKESAKKWFEWYSTSPEVAQYLWKYLKSSPTIHISPDQMRKLDPVKAKELEMIKKYPKKLIRFWEATPVEIVEFAVDAFYEMLSQPEKYMEVIQSIEKKAKETWPKYDVRY